VNTALLTAVYAPPIVHVQAVIRDIIYLQLLVWPVLPIVSPATLQRAFIAQSDSICRVALVCDVHLHVQLVQAPPIA